MIYNEIKGNLFDVGPEYVLAHCVSADFKMGLGIAKTFNDLGCQEEILKKVPDYDWQSLDYSRALWTRIPYSEDRHPKGVYHLVTKERYFHKPTYQDIYDALYDLRYFVHNGDKIAMPKIGCGLDKLEWSRVRKIIFQLFKNMNVEILVCSLK